LSHSGRAIAGALDGRGASFFGDLVNATGLLRTEVEKGLGELVAWGLVTADSFAGLRALLVPSDRRRPVGGFRRRGKVAPFGVETAGRWSRVRSPASLPEDQVAEAVAWRLPRRYGRVFRRPATNRILYRDGIPVAVREGAGTGERYLVDATPEEQERLKAALVRGRVAPLVRAYLGKSRPGTTAASGPR